MTNDVYIATETQTTIDPEIKEENAMEKVKLPKEVGEELDRYKDRYDFDDLARTAMHGSIDNPLRKYWSHNGSNALLTLADAWRYGWEDAEKPKRYVLPMPGTEYHNVQMHGNAQYYAIKGTGNWRTDAIALGADDAVKHGYTVTQSDIDAAPGWVKAITPVGVTDDAD